jgi:hypothetical protein
VGFSFFAYRLPITAEGRAPTSADSNPLPQGDPLVDKKSDAWYLGQRSARGGYLPLAFAASTVRYPIPERIFDYVSMVRSAMTGTCQLRTRVLQDAAVLAVVGGWRKITA